MEIQLDPRGIRIRTSAGWKSFSPKERVEAIISALVEDRNSGGFIPADAIGVATTRADTTDSVVERALRDFHRGAPLRKSAPSERLVRVMPADPKLRRPKPRRQAIGMSLEDLLS